MRYQASNFSIETPDDWQDRSIVSFAAPVAPNEFAPNIVITKEAVSGVVSAEDYAHRQFDIARGEIAGLKILKQENVFVGGKPAVEITQAFAAHDLNLQQLQFFVLLEAEICVITCTATAGSFNQYLPRFKEILASLQISS